MDRLWSDPAAQGLALRVSSSGRLSGRLCRRLFPHIAFLTQTAAPKRKKDLLVKVPITLPSSFLATDSHSWTAISVATFLAVGQENTWSRPFDQRKEGDSQEMHGKPVVSTSLTAAVQRWNPLPWEARLPPSLPVCTTGVEAELLGIPPRGVEGVYTHACVHAVSHPKEAKRLQEMRGLKSNK